MNYPRRRFMALASQSTLVFAASLAALTTARSASASSNDAPELVIDDPDNILGRTQAPVSAKVKLNASLRRAAKEGRLFLRERKTSGTTPAPLIPAQLLPGPVDDPTHLCWLMPEGVGLRRFFSLEAGKHPASQPMFAGRQTGGPQFVITESGQPVLQYNYSPVEPGDVLASVAERNRKYAVTRSDYIHPLYGLAGEVLTKDWPVDHPHHRGIYWAWPEVDWHGERGDLHALQRVFARPTGRCEGRSGPVFAQINAENVWKWEDREPIVREKVALRAYRAGSRGRVLDLEFQFEALGDPVKLARRDTTHYGGLNLRLGPAGDQQITKYTDPVETRPRKAWSDLSGTFPGAAGPSGLTVIQCAANPDYPGDWIDFPVLNWLQPTFPASGARYELRPGAPLTLRFRIWIHAGPKPDERIGAELWQAAHAECSPRF